MSQVKPTLIYIGDPMCSWCYGFSPQISKVKKELSNDVDFELVMGGLRPYNTETMEDLGDFLKDHWKHVEQKSDVDFNYGILSDKSFVYDTEPPARAVVVVRKLKPEVEFDFFQDVQKAFYAQNMNTNEIETYFSLITKYGISEETFTKEFNSSEMKELIKADYQKSSSMGVRGFPSTVLKTEEGYYIISNGFTTSEDIVQKVKNYLDKT